MSRLWRVVVSAEFENWWNGLSARAQEAVSFVVKLLEARGPSLDHPYSSSIRGSGLARMRELRIRHRGRPLRVLYAFDPQRSAVLLVGGDKGSDSRWYRTNVPLAEQAYAKHCASLED
jgi:hypothetical protein